MAFVRPARLYLRGSGLLLIALGIVHLAATPHIPDLLRKMPASGYQRAIGPTLLNHVLVGVLLLPLGYSQWLAAGELRQESKWAKQLLVVNALTVLALPILLAIFMRRPEYYRSPLFVIGVALVALVSMLTVFATWAVALQKIGGSY